MQAICATNDTQLELRNIPSPEQLPSSHVMVSVEPAANDHRGKVFRAQPFLAGWVAGSKNNVCCFGAGRWFGVVMGFLLLLPAPSKAQSIRADDIVGTWEALDKTLKLEISHAGSAYEVRMLYGNKLVGSVGINCKSDGKNPDASLRSRSTKGIIFVKGLTWGRDQWTGGTLYDASTGKTYRCKVESKDGTLQLRGCMGVPACGQTVVLSRTSDASPRP